MELKVAVAKEIHNLTQRMNSGVSTARAYDACGSSQESRDRLFQNRLNRRAVRLGLPAAVIRAVILNGELDIHDGLVTGWLSGFSPRHAEITAGLWFRPTSPYFRRRSRRTLR